MGVMRTSRKEEGEGPFYAYVYFLKCEVCEEVTWSKNEIRKVPRL